MSDGLFDAPGEPSSTGAVVGRVVALGGADASGDPGGGRRAGPPAPARFAAAPPGRGLGCGVGHPLRTAGNREDDAGVADLAGDRPPVRGAVGAVGGRQGGPCRHRRRPSGGRTRRTDRAVHRRGAPVLQDPAGRAAVGRREPGGAACRRHHGEPVVLGRCAAAVAVADPAAATPVGRGHRNRRPSCHRRPARTRRKGGGRRRGRRSSGAAVGGRRSAGVDGAGGGGRSGRDRSPSRRSSSRWTRRRSVTTATAISTTTSSARSSSPSAAPMSTPRCTTWRGCWSRGRTRGSSRAG